MSWFKRRKTMVQGAKNEDPVDELIRLADRQFELAQQVQAQVKLLRDARSRQIGQD